MATDCAVCGVEWSGWLRGLLQSELPVDVWYHVRDANPYTIAGKEPPIAHMSHQLARKHAHLRRARRRWARRPLAQATVLILSSEREGRPGARQSAFGRYASSTHHGPRLGSLGEAALGCETVPCGGRCPPDPSYRVPRVWGTGLYSEKQDTRYERSKRYSSRIN